MMISDLIKSGLVEGAGIKKRREKIKNFVDMNFHAKDLTSDVVHQWVDLDAKELEAHAQRKLKKYIWYISLFSTQAVLAWYFLTSKTFIRGEDDWRGLVMFVSTMVAFVGVLLNLLFASEAESAVDSISNKPDDQKECLELCRSDEDVESYRQMVVAKRSLMYGDFKLMQRMKATKVEREMLMLLNQPGRLTEDFLIENRKEVR